MIWYACPLSLLNKLISIIFFYFLGLAREKKNTFERCKDILQRTLKLRNKIDKNLPKQYNQNVFCAQNAKEDEATCPGDSGKDMINIIQGFSSSTVF